MAIANHRQAEAEVDHLLRRALPGARSSVDLHIRRVRRMTNLIWSRFQVGPYRWQVKHLRWCLEHGLAGLSPASRYDYWRSAEKAIVALGRETDWLPFLRGPWLRPNGDDSKRHETSRPRRLPCCSR